MYMDFIILLDQNKNLLVLICAFFRLVFCLTVVYTGQTISGIFSFPHTVPETVSGTNNHIRRFPSKIPFVWAHRRLQPLTFFLIMEV